MVLRTMCLASIGMIGGADGPTVIYTTDQTPFFTWIAIAICGVAIALLVFPALRRRK